MNLRFVLINNYKRKILAKIRIKKRKLGKKETKKLEKIFFILFFFPFCSFFCNFMRLQRIVDFLLFNAIKKTAAYIHTCS